MLVCYIWTIITDEILPVSRFILANLANINIVDPRYLDFGHLE